MAYTIYNNNGNILLTLPEGQIDEVTTSLTLIGKNVNNYGEHVNNNFVKVLTNFASSESNSPISPQPGQLWFNLDKKQLNVYDGTRYQPTFGANISEVAPVTLSSGELWFDLTNGQLKVWDGDEFKLVGPATTADAGQFGILPADPPLKDSIFNQSKNVGVLYAYDDQIGLLNPSEFIISADSAEEYLGENTATVLIAGLTIPKNLEVKGNIVSRSNTTVDGNLTVKGSIDVDSIALPIAFISDLTSDNITTVQTGTFKSVVTTDLMSNSLLVNNGGEFGSLESNTLIISSTSTFTGPLISSDQTVLKNNVKVSADAFSPVPNGSNLSVEGSFAVQKPSAVIDASTYTVADTDFSLRFSAILGCEVTLPDPAAFPGRILVINNTSLGNPVTSLVANVMGLGDFPPTPQQSILPPSSKKFAMLQSDGENWIVIMAN